MLITGKRIEVVTSSAIRRGACVRKGSTGFIIETGHAHIQTVIGKPIALIPTHISFSRFGFEKRKRLENKWVYAMLPLFSVNADNIGELDKIASALINSKLFNKYENTKKIKTFVTIKLATTNIIKNKDEFSSWLVSIIKSNRFERSLIQTKETPLNTELRAIMDQLGLKRPFFIWTIDKDKQSDLIDTVFKNKEKYRLFELIFTRLSLLDLAKSNEIKKKYLGPRIVLPPLDDPELCRDAWFLSLVSNNGVKFTGETLKLVNIIFSVNETLKLL